MKFLVALTLLATSLLAVAGPVSAVNGALELETVAQVPLIDGETVEVRAISGDYALLSSFPWTSIHRLNYQTGQVLTHTYAGGIFAYDISDTGRVLFAHRDETSNQGRFAWNPDTGVIERFDRDTRYDQDRFDTNSGLQLPISTQGAQNVAGTLEHTADLTGVRLPGGQYQSAPDEYSVFEVARTEPIALAFKLGIDQYGFTVVSHFARWNVATGTFDVYPIDINAFISPERTASIAALDATGNLAVKQTTNGQQTIVRLITATNTVQTATTVAGIVAAADYNPGSHAQVLRLYQAIFGRFPDLGGAKYWIDINNQGHDVLAIAGYMSASPEWGNTYSGTTDPEFVEIVYTNVLGRDYDQAGYDYWLDLAQGTNNHGNNTNRAQLPRPDIVFYVTANTEFTDAYPFQP